MSKFYLNPKRLSIALLLATGSLTTVPALALTCVNQTTGLWDDGALWTGNGSDCTAPPAMGDVVYIVPGTGTVSLNGVTTPELASIQVYTNATLDDAGSSAGAVTTNGIGVFTAVSNSIPSPPTIIDFTKNNSNITTTGNITVGLYNSSFSIWQSGLFKMGSGTLTIGGNVTINPDTNNSTTYGKFLMTNGGTLRFTGANAIITSVNGGGTRATIELKGTSANPLILDAAGNVTFDGGGNITLDYVHFSGGIWSKAATMTGTWSIVHCTYDSGATVPADWNCTLPPTASEPEPSKPGLPPLPPTMNLKVDFRGNGAGSLKVQTGKNFPGTDSTLGTCKNGDECYFPNLETASWVKLTPTADAGSEFHGWGGTTYCQNGNPFMISNVSCIAYFSTLQAPHYPLTVTKTGTGAGTVSSFNGGINCGSTCANNFDSSVEIELTAEPAAGSKFIGWSGDCAGDSPHAHLKVTQAKTCNAQFDLLPPPPPSQYPLTITKSGDGNGVVVSQEGQINCSDTCNSTFNENSEVILTAKADPDAQFIEWKGDCASLDNPLKVTMTAAKSCNAVFDLKQLDPVLPPTVVSEKLSVEKHGDGLAQITTDPAGLVLHFDDTSGAEATADYPKDSVVKLVMETQAGTEFIGFEGDPDCADATVTMDVSKHCLAHFKMDKPVEPPVTPPPPVEPPVTPPTTELEPPVVIAPPPQLEPQSEREPINDLPPATSETCPTDRHYNVHLDEACNAEGKTIENFKVIYGGSLANVIITGKLISEGLISNLTLESTAVLEGGYVTNFIINKGLMKNFTFVGKQIKGGKLAGKIIIASKVLNEIRDVILIAGTVIQGKIGEEFATAKLAGKIIGDATDPALLENVTIEDGTELENVILGEGVVLGQNVKQKNVMMVCTQQRANGKGFNAGGFPFDDNQTCFAVQENTIALTIDSASDYLKQTAEHLFVVIQGQKAFMFTHEWQEWNGELATLESGSTLDLKTVQTLVLPDYSQFTGNFKLYAGLRLTDGTVLYYQVQ